jgi:hypothetical protein
MNGANNRPKLMPPVNDKCSQFKGASVMGKKRLTLEEKPGMIRELEFTITKRSVHGSGLKVAIEQLGEVEPI